MKELIKVSHDTLVTMLIPGYLLTKNFFPFVCQMEKEVVNVFYDHLFHKRIQNKKAITGRRNEIFYYEMFGWKKKSNDE